MKRNGLKALSDVQEARFNGIDSQPIAKQLTTNGTQDVRMPIYVT